MHNNDGLQDEECTDAYLMSSGAGKDSAGQFRKQLRKTMQAMPDQTHMMTRNDTPRSKINWRRVRRGTQRDHRKEEKRGNIPKSGHQKVVGLTLLYTCSIHLEPLH